MNRVFAWPGGQGRRSAPLWQSAVYLLTATVGGLVVGLALAAFVVVTSRLSLEARQLVAVPALFVVAGLQLSGSMAFLPQRRRQVPQEWLARSPLVHSGLFGFVLGAGVLTWLRHPAAYAVPLLLVVLGDPWLALLTGAAFGFARGVSPLWTRLLVRTEAAALRLERFMAGRGFALAGRVAGSTLVGVGLVLVVLVPTVPGGS